jgi:broad specificity phosphatase PhoE
MAVVHLVRHGQASFGAADYDVLSANGRRQAAVLGRELARRGVRPDRVVTGSMLRQRDTAAVALEAGGLAVVPEVDVRWNEYDHLSLLEHHRAENRRALAVGVMTNGRARTVQRALDGALGEWVAAGACTTCVRPWPVFRDETASALGELLTSLGPGGTGVVVTSGGVVAAICTGLLGTPPEALVRLNRVVVNASVTKVVRGRSGTSLLSFNEHAFLEGDDPALVTYR